MSTFAKIPGFPGYEIATNGLVLSKRCSTHKFIYGYIQPNGYHRIKLRLDGGTKKVFIHRLVLLAHVGPPPSPSHVAAHSDGDHTNNDLSNLRWATQAENCADAIRHGTWTHGEKVWNAKLNPKIAKEIYCRAMSGEKYRSISDDLQIANSTVWLIANGRQWVAATGAGASKCEGV